MNRLALSISTTNTESVLTLLDKHHQQVGLAEICLGTMDTFDLWRLITNAPCPLIITCRPIREGGAFAGCEQERLEILTEAARLGATYIDVEWDAVDKLCLPADCQTKLIVSRHWFEEMPSAQMLGNCYNQYRSKANVVKFAAMAHQPADMLPIFSFLYYATTPVIGLAMGNKGWYTRLLSLCFANCLLTFVAPDRASINAPGQITLEDALMYRMDRLSPSSKVVLGNSIDHPLEDVNYIPWVADPSLLTYLKNYLPHVCLHQNPYTFS